MFDRSMCIYFIPDMNIYIYPTYVYTLRLQMFSSSHCPSSGGCLVTPQYIVCINVSFKQYLDVCARLKKNIYYLHILY